MADFFTSSNPIVLLLTVFVVLALVKIFISKLTFFSGESAAYIPLVLIIVGVLLLIFNPLLRIISYSIPYLMLIILFVFFLGGIYFVFGMPQKQIWPILKTVGPLKLAIQIGVFCIIALAISSVYGERLLESSSPTGSVSLTDAFKSDEPQSDSTVVSKFFSPSLLGILIILIVLGMAFCFVLLSS
jgi:hypothetical protein